MLRCHPSREGLFDSLIAARIAERVVELEESAAVGEVKSASDVPLWARIRLVIPRFEEAERKVVVGYSRLPTLTEQDGEWDFEETMVY